MKYKALRKKYPKFVYENYSWKISKNGLELFFNFRVPPDPAPEQARYGAGIFFRPKIAIKNVDKKMVERIGDRVLDNLVFNLGLMEIPSYWKATCSPEIEIRAGSLNPEQTRWWKDLIIRGMGQFFYENKIDWREPNFLTIKSAIKSIQPNFTNQAIAFFVKFDEELNKNKFLVPVGGGRDAIVTLELLKRRKKKYNAFLVNPTGAAKEVLKVARIKNPIMVERKIDPTLLKLNRKGYLNGHTPFTALLSFLAVTCAVLFDYKNIAFSLEKSANEGNVRYLGRMINHQWAKSSEFERKFKWYLKKYLAKNVNYFSPLRPYTELEISKMFLKYPRYFSAFSSCNARLAEAARRRVTSRGRPAFAKSYSEARWCGNCSKCLFVYATFYPFLDKKTLLKIFGRDIFDASTSSAQEKKKLLLTMKGLLGQGRAKPFECVGTKKESKLAFSLSLKKAKKSGKMPYLLRKVK